MANEQALLEAAGDICQIMKDAEEAAAADAGFDAGEFSSGWHDWRVGERIDRALAERDINPEEFWLWFNGGLWKTMWKTMRRGGAESLRTR